MVSRWVVGANFSPLFRLPHQRREARSGEILDDGETDRQRTQGCSRLARQLALPHLAIAEIANALYEGVGWWRPPQQIFPKRMIQAMPFLLHTNKIPRKTDDLRALR